MTFISENNLASLLGISNKSVQAWANKRVYLSVTFNGQKGFNMEDLHDLPEVGSMLESRWKEETDVLPLRQYNSVELFAGGGGLALGMSLAGFHHILLNEFETTACRTLKYNKPEWNVIEGDVRHIDFTPLNGKVDFLSGGFPCQTFSYAGKGAGFNDTRGTMFFELARAVKEIQPKVFMGENVKGLISHQDGRTFETIRNAIAELGYTLVEPRVLRAIMYQVPQKRERLIFIAIRNDIAEKVQFHWPTPYYEVLNLRDVLYKGIIYDCDVPKSEGVQYSEKKKRILAMVPQGGDWRDLPEEVAKEYMGGSWLLGGGKTGMARRLSLDEPSLTLTCSPCQKQTERCHPIETRPLSVREYARIQTFPDYWQFQGSMSDKYKQIGNAVPVNLAWAVGRSLIRLFNNIQTIFPEKTQDCSDAVRKIMYEQSQLEVVKNRVTQTSMVKKNTYKQLSLFDLFDQYAFDSITENSMMYGDIPSENRKSGNVRSAEPLVDETDSVLVSLVKKDDKKIFLDGSATVYYTGKKFPAIVALNKLYYFMPYIKGRGVRDLYLIKKVRLCYPKEGIPKVDKGGLRLVFEIDFLKHLFNDYKPVELKIWKMFAYKTLGEIISEKSLDSGR